ncbi:MAG: DNA/RNA nuclease SfsA [Oscillospiraceae bacterium]|nr:DNA/RNA nuclease SfsA [Oscillospiraceae bacterium]
MRYTSVCTGRFLARPNRFIAQVEIGGRVEVCHVKNTGRCRELLTPGAAVYLEHCPGAARRTQYDLIAVEKQGRLINMDAQAPNRVFAEFARVFEPEATQVRSEVTVGQSRLDFCLYTPAGPHYVEVKGVTLEEDGHCRFPDAPTERGVRHLQELTRLAGEGVRATVFFVVQMERALDLAPNDATHPAFGAALRAAAAAGVRVVAYTCRVTPEEIVIHRQIPVIL